MKHFKSFETQIFEYGFALFLQKLDFLHFDIDFHTNPEKLTHLVFYRQFAENNIMVTFTDIFGNTNFGNFFKQFENTNFVFLKACYLECDTLIAFAHIPKSMNADCSEAHSFKNRKYNCIYAHSKQ